MKSMNKSYRLIVLVLALAVIAATVGGAFNRVRWNPETETKKSAVGTGIITTSTP